jgi:hypothetical protein
MQIPQGHKYNFFFFRFFKENKHILFCSLLFIQIKMTKNKIIKNKLLNKFVEKNEVQISFKLRINMFFN